MTLKSTLKRLKLNESTISMILGALVIIVVGVAAINFLGDSDAGETIPAVETEDLSSNDVNNNNLPTTHTVQEGEDLWKISQQYYNNGYRWVDIAEANNISEPDQLESGQEITIPELTDAVAEAEVSPTSSVLAQADNEQQEPTQTPEITEEPEATATAEPTQEPEPTLSEQTDDQETVSEQEPEVEITGETYSVVQGDTLWSIAERAYGDPYRWVDIAEANDLINPDLIHPGNTFNLPR